MTIFNMNIGQVGKIKSVNGDDALAKRLKALGCVEGTTVEVKMKAPLGDPLIISFRNTDLAIRKKDAKNIYMTA